MVCHAILTAAVAHWGLHMSPWMTALLLLLALHPLLCMVSMLVLLHAAWSLIWMYADPALFIPAAGLAYLTYVRVARPHISRGSSRGAKQRSRKAGPLAVSRSRVGAAHTVA